MFCPELAGRSSSVIRDTYTKSVRLRTEHVTQEKVPELDWKKSSKKKTPLLTLDVA
jgi:hypothetical protein